MNRPRTTVRSVVVTPTNAVLWHTAAPDRRAAMTAALTLTDWRAIDSDTHLELQRMFDRSITDRIEALRARGYRTQKFRPLWLDGPISGGQ